MSDRRSPPIVADNGNNSDKPSEAGAGAAGISHDFRQNHAQRRLLPPQPHELTAEWTVRAQLTFARAGEKVQREFSSNDPINPVRVVYKWSTFDTNTNPDDSNDNDESTRTSTTLLNKQSSASSSRDGGGGSSCQSAPLKPFSKVAVHRQQKQHESFRSTTSSTNADYCGGDSAFSGSNASKTQSQTYKQQQQQEQQQQNQQTSTGPNGIGGGRGANAAALYGTRCRSTCNITVSAVADFLPPEAVAAAAAEAAATSTTSGGTTDFIQEEEPDPFVFNTTACYTVLPEKTHEGSTTPGTPSASKSFTSLGKILALRDAFSQTSDTETKYFEEQELRRRYSNSRSPIAEARSAYDDQQNRLHQLHQQQQRKTYEHRRATAEALLQSTHHHMSPKQVDEGNSNMPSLTPSPPIQQTFKSTSMPRIPPLPGGHRLQSTHPSQHPTRQGKSATGSGTGEPQKKPRTVHIDVYCTGSEDDEDDDQADAEASSSSVSEDEGGSKRRLDLESNSTPQTVFDNEQMLLRHKRITGQSQLPRRLTAAQQPQQEQSLSSKSPQSLSSQSDVMKIGHAITKSSTAEEVSESKQLLFRKHVGDQRAAKLAALRQKYIRQASDDALSSNYPNSSRSTVREATCSSISSVVASSQADCGDSSWKDTEELEDVSYSLAKSDSFEYENSQDRLRIRQMENLWSSSLGGTGSDGRPNSPAGRLGHTQATSFLHPISEGNSQRNSPFQRNDTLPSESENFSPSDTDVLYTYPGRLGSVAHYQRQFQNMTAQRPATSQTNRPGFLQFFGPQSAQHDSPLAQPPVTDSATVAQSPQQLTEHNLLYPNYQPNLQRWKSETRDNLSANPTPTMSPSDLSQRNSPQQLTTATTATAYSPSPQRSGSEAPPTTTTALTFPQSPMVARRFEMQRDSPSVSEASTIVLGYTSEYLEKARKFGKVVSTARKPGHHIGPTKNPNCSCESCVRWMAERFQLRGRAFSLGERPVLKRPT